MGNITSIKTQQQSPSLLLPLLLVVIGFGLFLAGPWGIVCGLLLMVLVAIMLRSQSVMHHIVLCTNSGETSAIASDNLQFVTKVVDALNHSIIHRG
jgi:hypothetical protein